MPHVKLTDAFHHAMLASAGLLVSGGAVNAVGIRNPSRESLESQSGGGAQTAA